MCIKNVGCSVAVSRKPKGFRKLGRSTTVSDFHPSMTLYIRTADNTISSFLSGSVLKIVS